MVDLGTLMPVRLPKTVSINNAKLSLIQLGIRLIVLIGIAILAITDRIWLSPEVPTGYPNAWGSQDNNLASVLSSREKDYKSPLCTNNAEYFYKYGTGFTYGQYQCVPAHAAESFFKVGNSQVYFPTSYSEKMFTVKSGADQCQLMRNSTCIHNDGCDSDNDLDMKGRTCFKPKDPKDKLFIQKAYVEKLEKGAPTGKFEVVEREVCECSQEKNFVVAGVGAQSMSFEHTFDVSSSDTTRDGYSSTTSAEAEELAQLAGAGDLGELGKTYTGMVTIIKFINTRGKIFEIDCYDDRVAWEKATGLKSIYKKKGKCRFYPGETITLPLSTWVKAAGSYYDPVTGGQLSLEAENRNSKICNNGWSSVDLGLGTNEKPLAQLNTAAKRENLSDKEKDARCAPSRITGVNVLISIKYEYHNYHNEAGEPDEDGNMEYDNGRSFTLNDKMVATVLVKANPGWTGLPRHAYGAPPEAGLDDASTHRTGNFRYRYYSGIKFQFKTSAQSRFGFFDLNKVLVQGAVLKIYFQMATAVTGFFALYMLGNLSKNYRRSVYDYLNIKKECESSLPSKILIACGAYHSLVQMLTTTANDGSLMNVVQLLRILGFRIPNSMVSSVLLFFLWRVLRYFAFADKLFLYCALASVPQVLAKTRYSAQAFMSPSRAFYVQRSPAIQQRAMTKQVLVPSLLSAPDATLSKNKQESLVFFLVLASIRERVESFVIVPHITSLFSVWLALKPGASAAGGGGIANGSSTDQQQVHGTGVMGEGVNNNPYALTTSSASNDHDGTGGKRRAKLTKVVLKACFTKIFGFGDINLDEATIEQMADAVFEEMATPKGDEVDIEKFVMAFIANERLSLVGVQKQFDLHRRKGIFEKFFDTPVLLPSRNDEGPVRKEVKRVKKNE